MDSSFLNLKIYCFSSSDYDGIYLGFVLLVTIDMISFFHQNLFDRIEKKKSYLTKN